MQMMSHRGKYCAAVAVVLAFLIGFSAFALAQDENTEVTKLLEQAKEKAAVLSQDADEMEALPRTDASWQTHAQMLDTVRQHVNDLARTVEKLTAARSSAAPWQQQAIDRMLPLMKELAANTTAAIQHLNQNKVRPVSPDYVEYLRANADTAHELTSTISNFVEYGRARARMDQLAQKLEIASK